MPRKNARNKLAHPVALCINAYEKAKRREIKKKSRKESLFASCLPPVDCATLNTIG
jgi:hypothetical protein